MNLEGQQLVNCTCELVTEHGQQFLRLSRHQSDLPSRKSVANLPTESVNQVRFHPDVVLAKYTMSRSFARSPVTMSPSEGGVMAAYVRYSSALQDATSLEDQLRKCREAATRLGCTIPDHLVFSDAAISGQSMENRPGLQEFLRNVRLKVSAFEGVVIDDSSRLARNQEEVLRLYKILRHHGIYT
jgi:hypothetical protein